MNVLAEVSDKIVSTGPFWAVMVILSFAVAAIAVGSRSWAAMLIAVPIAALAWMFTLSFFKDPVFADAVLQENGWSWFSNKLAASLLPIATVFVVTLWRRRRRDAVGFEVVPSGRNGSAPPSPQNPPLRLSPSMAGRHDLEPYPPNA
jgi:hypothetical protein